MESYSGEPTTVKAAKSELDRLDALEEQTWTGGGQPCDQPLWKEHKVFVVATLVVCVVGLASWSVLLARTGMAWWVLLLGVVGAGTFVAVVSSFEKKIKGVSVPAIPPKGLRGQVYFRMWPMMVCIFVMVNAQLWAIGTKQPFWVFLAIFALAMAVGIGGQIWISKRAAEKAKESVA